MTPNHALWILFVSLSVACSSNPDEVVGQQQSPLTEARLCPPGTNVILGTPGPDVLVGGNGRDCILGGDGDDVIVGSNGDDYLFGGTGNDQIDGGNGVDALVGGPGNDVLSGGNGDDRLDGGEGNDVLVGGKGADQLEGAEGDDVIDGGSGTDTVSGGSGTDQCTGPSCEVAEKRVATCASDSQCTGGARCARSGTCVFCLADTECDDGTVCTTDSCQPALGCRRPAVPNGTSCADATVCNGSETCQNGTCAAGTPLVCDDGLFCNGLETCSPRAGCQPGPSPVVDDDHVACTLDRCNEDIDAIEHAPSDAACGFGFLCTTQGCQNIDECSTGQNNCSPNATCRDRIPFATVDASGNPYTTPAFECSCRCGYEGDGATCTASCLPTAVATDVQRCVGTHDGTADLRLSSTDCQPWQGQYAQGDEQPFVNYCGPTAIKNFLYWYGADATYADLGNEMRTNTWDTGSIFAAIVGLGHLVGCIEPICWGIATSVIAGAVVNAGTLPIDMLAAMDRRAPPGYVACMKSGDENVDPIIRSLSEGNPVVFLESRGDGNLHWAVATGLVNDNGDLRLLVANSANRGVSQFQTDWSLSSVGDGVRRSFLSMFGLNSYTMLRWIRREEADGHRCP